MRIAKWASSRKEFSTVRFDNVLHNWEAVLACGLHIVWRLMSWVPPLDGALKFSVDGEARGKPGLIGVGRVLRNSQGDVLVFFSNSIGVTDSNEVEVEAILEAVCMFGYYI